MATLTIILLGILNLAAKAKGECCPLRVISGMGDLDDVYSLKKEVSGKPEEVCVDGCVYTRANASNPGEEYCFKNEQSSGSLVCQNTEDVASLDQGAIEDENRQLEAELVADQKEEDDAAELDGQLGDVDNKVEQLTSSSSRSVRAVPGTCNEMAALIEALETATTVAERLSIVKEILQSTITKCTDKTKLSSVKIKIKTVKTKNNEVLVAIRVKIRTKKNKIKANKVKLILIIKWKEQVSNPPPTLPGTTQVTSPMPETTYEEPVSGGSGGSTVSPDGGEEPVEVTTGGPPGTTVSPDGGEEPVEITTGPPGGEGEEPVEITPGGEEPVPITSGGEEPVTITAGGEEPVPITSGGEEPVPITSGGEEPVPISPGAEEPVAITMEGENPTSLDLTATTVM